MEYNPKLCYSHVEEGLFLHSFWILKCEFGVVNIYSIISCPELACEQSQQKAKGSDMCEREESVT